MDLLEVTSLCLAFTVAGNILTNQSSDKFSKMYDNGYHTLTDSGLIATTGPLHNIILP